MLALLVAVSPSWLPCAPHLPSSPVRPRAAVLLSEEAGDGVTAAPTLREQMKAYIESVQERGVELTPEQKEMLAEFEQEDDLLDQTGLPDFMQGAEVLSPEDFAAQQGEEAATEAPPPPPQPVAAPPPPPPPPSASPLPPPPRATVPATVPAPAESGGAMIDPAIARMWLMQRNEVSAATELLNRVAAGQPLSEAETSQLRALLASMVSTVAQSV